MLPPGCYIISCPMSFWDTLLSFALRAVVNRPADLEAWTRMPKCILFLLPFGVRKWAKPLASLIKDRIKAWNDGSFLELWSQACN